tara:strand:- start:985 stop:1209 length:225 start_codon:yes stop_codon:yes gene_type:complete
MKVLPEILVAGISLCVMGRCTLKFELFHYLVSKFINNEWFSIGFELCEFPPSFLRQIPFSRALCLFLVWSRCAI